MASWGRIIHHGDAHSLREPSKQAVAERERSYRRLTWPCALNYAALRLWPRDREALPDLFRPTIRVPLRASQADFKRANAK